MFYHAFSDEEETPEFWLNLGKEELMKALELQQLNMNVARNVIILLGELKFMKIKVYKIICDCAIYFCEQN